MSELDKILKSGPNGSAPRAEPPTAPEVEGYELPDLNAPDYKAHARAANKPVYALHCMLGSDGIRSFEYVQKDSNSSFRAEKEGQVIQLRFAGSKIWELTIGGLNLWRCYDLIHQHRMMWIRKSDRGFAEGKDGEPLITSIQIKEIEREVG